MKVGSRSSWALVGGFVLWGAWAWHGAWVSGRSTLSAVFGSSKN